uniref:Uncharacterized protein n=1 Tax=Rhizophora mucronata TaxID=61149 RepID=A0A2P2Q9U2_RHIMU
MNLIPNDQLSPKLSKCSFQLLT